ncbi:MAG: hypothetical protein ACREPB_13445, partial [Arenimonas sp.]
MQKNLFPIAARLFLLCSIACCTTVNASTLDGTHYSEMYRKMTAQAQGVQPLSGDIFGEQTDLYSGNTSFSITDIELPGNSALSVRLGRSLQVEDRKDTGYIGGFSDWDVDVPYIESTVDSNGWKVAPSGANAYNRCTSQAPPHFSNSFFIGTAWHGITINIPGSSHEKLLVSHTSTFSAPADGKSYPWTTLGNVRISCLASTKNGYPGEGFIALTPSGEKYYFDWVIERAAPKLVGPRVSYYAENILIRKRVFLLATRVEDRFGNWVNYTYSGDKLSQISANDGRTITLTYSGASVATASDGSRIWSYQYAAPSTTSEGGLSKVTLPDGTKWQYQKLGFLISGRRGDPDLLGADTWDPTCMEAEGAPMSPFKMVVTHPSNAIGEFSFTQNRQYRTNVPWLCRWVVPPGQRPMAGATSVQTLTAFNQSLYDELISRGVSISRATIAATSEVNIWEEGTTFEWQPGVDELLIPNYSDQLSLQTKKISGPGVPVRTTSYSYGEVDTFGFCGYGGDPQCAEVQVTPDTPIGSKWVTVTKPDGVKDRYRFGVQYGLTEGRLLQSQTLSPSNVVLNSQSNEYVSE